MELQYTMHSGELYAKGLLMQKCHLVMQINIGVSLKIKVNRYMGIGVEVLVDAGFGQIFLMSRH